MNNDLDFVQAWAALQDGKAVSRAKWLVGSKESCLRVRPDLIVPAIYYERFGGTRLYWVPKQEDLFAGDWTIVSD